MIILMKKKINQMVAKHLTPLTSQQPGNVVPHPGATVRDLLKLAQWLCLDLSRRVRDDGSSRTQRINVCCYNCGCIVIEMDNK